MDGNTLYEACNASGPSTTVLCTAYILGAIDAAMAYDDIYSPDNHHLCLPQNAIGKQVSDVVVKFLRENPEDRSSRAANSVAAAMIKSFPCQH